MDHELAALVKRVDPDRYFCALLAPAAARDALLALYAFDHELARASLVASMAPLALIRLQWWREVVEGAARKHEVATPLTAALNQGRLSRDLCLAMIEGRERETDGAFADMAAFEEYCLAAHGAAMAAAGAAVGCFEGEALRRLGAGCGAVWVMRKRQGLRPEGDVEGVAQKWLAAELRDRRCAGALPAVLARRDLRRARPRLVWDQLAVVGRAWWGV